MVYWCDDRALNVEQRRLDAQQALVVKAYRLAAVEHRIKGEAELAERAESEAERLS